MTATGTVGSGIIWILGRAVKAKLLYFRFDYPWEAVGLLAVMLLGICILFSGAVYYLEAGIWQKNYGKTIEVRNRYKRSLSGKLNVKSISGGRR